MAAITVTANINKDDAAASTRLNGEAANINGGTFTINSDVRWAQNTAVLGNIILSSTAGGTLQIDATNTWEIPFTLSTGIVPTLSTLGNNQVEGLSSGSTGELLRVWSNSSKLPLTSGAAMPVSGWIKLRSKAGEFSSGEVITLPGGATITISSVGKRSWLSIVGSSSSSIQTAGMGDFNAFGDWYELGTTTGASDQIFQYPIEDICPAVQVETSPGSGIYEWWLNGGARWNTATKFIPQDNRGKFFGCSTTGTITFGLSGANACGKIPTAGCKVRIPNILVSYSSAVNWDANLVSTTLTAKYSCTTTNYGKVNLNFLCGGLRFDIADAGAHTVKNSAFFDQIRFNNVFPLVLDNIAIGLSLTTSQNGLDISNILTSGEVKNVTSVLYASSTANTAAVRFFNLSDFTISNITGYSFGAATTVNRGAATVSSVLAQGVYNSTITNINCIGSNVSLLDCYDTTVNNIKHCDSLFSTTQSTVGQSSVEIINCTDTNIDNINLLFPEIINVHPYIAFAAITNSRNIDIRNIGLVDSPINCGSVNQTAHILNLTTSKNIACYRGYCINTRTGQVLNTDDTVGLTLVNVRTDFADAGQLIGKDVQIRGCFKTPYALAQVGNNGRPWEEGFSSSTVGFIMAMACTPTPATSEQILVTAGNPKFTSIGHIYLPTIGDQVEWIMPYYALGHTSISGITNTIVNPSFINLQFQYDLGSGFNGTWLTANTLNLTNIGSIDPNVGIKFKLRATATSNSALTRITTLRIDTVSSTSNQLIQYTLPSIGTPSIKKLTLSNIQSGSEIRILDQNMVELTGVEELVGNTFEYSYEYNPNTSVTIIIYNVNYKDVRFEYILSSNDTTLPIIQIIDRNFN